MVDQNYLCPCALKFNDICQGTHRCEHSSRGGGFIGMCRSEQLLLFIIIRHSPPGMPYGFVRIFFSFFFFFRRQGFRMITLDRQAGPLHNFNRSHVMVIGRSVSFSDPRDPRVGACGAPTSPNSPPPKKINLHAFQNPMNIFEKKNLVGKKT